MLYHRHLTLFAAALALPLASANAQNPQQIIQQVVEAERAANQNDKTSWIFLDHSVKPKEQVLQWTATTPQGNVVRRILVKDGRQQPESEQQAGMQKFLADTSTQKKQVSAKTH